MPSPESTSLDATIPAEPGNDATRPVTGRVLAALALVLVCYHASLWTLLRGITVDTPIAYLGLVPLLAAAVGYVRARPAPGEVDIHDRHVDRIVGVPLIAVSMLALVVLPARMSTMYWLYRIDLLTMPLFVAGVIVWCFGIRMLWRTKAAVAFLLLAWPIPVRWLVTMGLDPLTQLTAMAVRLITVVLPVAAAVEGDGVSFRVPHGEDGFLVQVATACSGANGLLGFLLVAGAFALVARGSRSAKWSWLAAGALFVWVVNLARILAILAVGRFAGERAAIDVLHPVAGLITFNLAVLIMVLLAERFGLSLPGIRTSSGGVGISASTSIRRAVPNARVALAVLAGCAVVGGIFDHGLTAYDPIASSVGSPRIAPFSKVGLRPEGFDASPVASFDHGRRFFGEDSTWIRYQYAGLGTDDLGSEVPVLADVVTTPDLQSFSDFGLEACYRFHGYGMGQVRRVDLGNGVVGSVLDWEDRNDMSWSTVYWVWAVRVGGETRFERVVLLLNDSEGARVASPPLERSLARQVGLRVDEAVRGGGDEQLSDRQVERRGFLVQFARRVIQSSTDRSAALAPASEFGD